MKSIDARPWPIILWMAAVVFYVLTAAILVNMVINSRESERVTRAKMIENERVFLADSNRRIKQLVNDHEVERLKLESEISVLNNRVKLAKESCELYERLLDDSNEVKLLRAREMLDQALGE